METGPPYGGNPDGKLKRRESKAFRPEVICKIYDALEEGAPIQVASELAGVIARTVHSWMSQGKIDEQDLEDGHLDHQTAHAEFYIECRRCIAKYIMGRLKKIKEAGDDPFNWKANTQLLIYVDNELFGRKQTVTMDVQETREITVTIVDSSTWMKTPPSVPAITSGDVVEGTYRELNNDVPPDEEEEEDGEGDGF